MSDYELVELTGELMKQGERAVLIKFVNATGADQEEWFPKSQLTNRKKDENMVTCDLPRWLAEDRGVI